MTLYLLPSTTVDLIISRPRTLLFPRLPDWRISLTWPLPRNFTHSPQTVSPSSLVKDIDPRNDQITSYADHLMSQHYQRLSRQWRRRKYWRQISRRQSHQISRRPSRSLSWYHPPLVTRAKLVKPSDHDVSEPLDAQRLLLRSPIIPYHLQLTPYAPIQKLREGH